MDTSSDSVMALQDTDEGFVEEEIKAKSEGMAPPLGLPAHFALEGTAEHSIVSSLLMCISQKSAFCQASWMTYLMPSMQQLPQSKVTLAPFARMSAVAGWQPEVGSMQTFLSCSISPTRDPALSQHFCTILPVSIRV